MTTVISEYTSALQSSMSTYAHAVHPAPACLPTDRYEVNLRSNRPAEANNGISFPGLYQHAASNAHIDIGLRAGKRQIIHAPHRGTIHVNVEPDTRILLDAFVRSDMPSATVTFSRAVWIDDALDGKMGSVANALCGYWLESIEFDKHGAVVAHGRVADRLGVINKRWSQTLQKAPKDSQSHGFFRLVSATGRAAVHAIPDPIRQGAGRIFGFGDRPAEPPQDEYALLLRSIFTLLEPGSLTARGSLTADKAIVIRTDGAEIVLGPQDFAHSISADVIPTAAGLQLNLRPSDDDNPDALALRSDALALNMQGSVLFDSSRTLAGSNINLQIKKLRFDALINNGEQDQILVALHIDSQQADPHVATVKGDFHFGKELKIAGNANFSLPASIHQTNRRVAFTQGSLQIDSGDFDMLMEGSVAIQQGVFPDSPAIIPERTARIRFGVREMELHGHLDSSPAYTEQSHVQASVPVHIHASSSERRALRIEADYHSRGSETQTGVTVGFLCPMRIDPPTRLAVATQAGAVEINRMIFTAVGEAHLGSHVKVPGLDVEGKGAALIERIDGTIHAKPNAAAGISLNNSADLRLCGSHPDAGKRPQAGLKVLLKRPTNGSLQLRGRGGLTVPCDLPMPQTLEVQIPGGLQFVKRAKARLRCDPFSFEMGREGLKLDTQLFTEYAAELRGCYGTQVHYAGNELQLTPQAVCPSSPPAPPAEFPGPAEAAMPSAGSVASSSDDGYKSALDEFEAELPE